LYPVKGTEGRHELFIKEISPGRLNTAEDVAQISFWLYHGDSFITG
jgi:hypothetical protein